MTTDPTAVLAKLTKLLSAVAYNKRGQPTSMQSWQDARDAMLLHGIALVRVAKAAQAVAVRIDPDDFPQWPELVELRAALASLAKEQPRE